MLLFSITCAAVNLVVCAWIASALFTLPYVAVRLLHAVDHLQLYGPACTRSLPGLQARLAVGAADLAGKASALTALLQQRLARDGQTRQQQGPPSDALEAGA